MHNRLKDPTHFNYSVSMDTMHIEWEGEQRQVLVMQDDYSKLEKGGEVEKDNFKSEKKIRDEWFQNYGPPNIIRTHQSGAHMSDNFMNYLQEWGVQVKLIPADAHHHLGSIERSHAVRRHQLELYNK